MKPTQTCTLIIQLEYIAKDIRIYIIRMPKQIIENKGASHKIVCMQNAFELERKKRRLFAQCLFKKNHTFDQK